MAQVMTKPIVCIVGFGVVLGGAVTDFVEMQHRAVNAEVPANVDGFKLAIMAYEAASGDLLGACGSRSQAEVSVSAGDFGVDSPWAQDACWEKLSAYWSPNHSRGAYWVEEDSGSGDSVVFGMQKIRGTVYVYQSSNSTDTARL